MRRAAARHAAGRILHEAVRRWIAVSRNDRRTVVAPPQLDTNRGEFLAEPGEDRACPAAFAASLGAILLHLGRYRDIPDVFRQRTRGRGVADRNRLALGLIGSEQIR